MTPTSPRSTALFWARFPFSVVGSLLAAPPSRGPLKGAIESLAAKNHATEVAGLFGTADEFARVSNGLTARVYVLGACPVLSVRGLSTARRVLF